jgi:hypothetical protein
MQQLFCEYSSVSSAYTCYAFSSQISLFCLYICIISCSVVNDFHSIKLIRSSQHEIASAIVILFSSSTDPLLSSLSSFLFKLRPRTASIISESVNMWEMRYIIFLYILLQFNALKHQLSMQCYEPSTTIHMVRKLPVTVVAFRTARPNFPSFITLFGCFQCLDFWINDLLLYYKSCCQTIDKKTTVWFRQEKSVV